MLFLWEKALFFTILKKVAEVRVSVFIYYIGKGYFLTGHSEKGYQYQNFGHTV